MTVSALLQQVLVIVKQLLNAIVAIDRVTEPRPDFWPVEGNLDFADWPFHAVPTAVVRAINSIRPRNLAEGRHRSVQGLTHDSGVTGEALRAANRVTLFANQGLLSLHVARITVITIHTRAVGQTLRRTKFPVGFEEAVSFDCKPARLCRSLSNNGDAAFDRLWTLIVCDI